MIWHLDYTDEASATAFTRSYQEFQHTAFQQEPSSRVRESLTDGFSSATESMRTLFPGVCLGQCVLKSGICYSKNSQGNSNT